MKRLSVFAGSQLVGHLQENERFELVFSYTPDWLAKPNAFALSPNLPLTEQTISGDGVTAFFENLLPEGDVPNFISKAAHIKTRQKLLSSLLAVLVTKTPKSI